MKTADQPRRQSIINVSKWLLISDHPHSKEALVKLGWKDTSIITPVYQLTTGAGMGHLEALRLRAVQGLWIDMPGYMATSNRKSTKVSYRLQDFIAQAKRNDVPVFCIATCGPTWKSETVLTLLRNQELATSYHHACQLNIVSQNDPTKFSAAIWRIASNISMSHQDCNHGQEAGHERDWSAHSHEPHAAIQNYKVKQDRQDKVMTAVLATLGCRPCVASSSRTPTVPEQTSAYPTDERVRQQAAIKLAKADGTYVKKKRKFHVEAIFDDCGDDLSGLGLEGTYLAWGDPDDASESSASNEDWTSMCQWWLKGSEYDGGLPQQSLQTFIGSSMVEVALVARRMESTDDVFEMCGGAARTSVVCLRMRLNVGKNFDLTTHTDLTSELEVKALWSYITTSKPMVAILTPPCTPFGPYSHLNRVTNYDTWLQSYRECAPLAKLSGQIAIYQLEHGRHFVMETPYPSELILEEPWPRVRMHPRTIIQVIHQCMTGQRASDGHLVKKPTQMWVSDEALQRPLAGLMCNGKHEHSPVGLHNRDARRAQLWTWSLANAVAEGIRLLLRKVKNKRNVYPVAVAAKWTCEACRGRKASIDASHTRNPETCKYPNCYGCRNNKPQTDQRHTRLPDDCRYPLTEADSWECPKCKDGVTPRATPGHSYLPGDCRWATAQSRRAVGRNRLPGREGQVRLRASEEPTGSLAIGEDVDAPDISEALPSQLPASLPPAPIPGVEASSSSSADPRAVRGPDQEQRVRRTFQDSGVGTDPIAGSPDEDTPGHQNADWTAFDISSSLRVLRTGTEAALRRTLRRLHLRWWHASVAKMNNLLKHAGVPDLTLQLIPQIVDTCRECRLWWRPGPRNIASSALLTEFNIELQADLIFYDKHIVFHMVCAAIRWHVAAETSSKEEEDLLTILITRWFQVYGAPKVLVIDGEKALGTVSAGQALARWGCSRKPKAPNQHAYIIEKRGDLLRTQLKLTDTQMRAENIVAPFPVRLAEAVFAGNAMLSINGSTPYNALFGRQPQMLPSLDGSAAALNDTTGNLEGMSRHVHRIRELALQNIVAGTAQKRIERALKTRTIAAGEEQKYEIGEEVDFYRPPSSKDVSGWKGPAHVSDISHIVDGNISIRWQGHAMICRMQDVRRALAYLCFLVAPGTNIFAEDPLDIIRGFMTQLHHQSLILGWIHPRSGWTMSKDTPLHMKVYLACLHLAACGLHQRYVVAARLAAGVGHLDGLDGFEESQVFWWDPSTPENVSILTCPGTQRISLRVLCGSNWEHHHIIQLLSVQEATAESIATQSPHIPHLGGPYVPSLGHITWRSVHESTAQASPAEANSAERPDVEMTDVEDVQMPGSISPTDIPVPDTPEYDSDGDANMRDEMYLWGNELSYWAIHDSKFVTKEEADEDAECNEWDEVFVRSDPPDYAQDGCTQIEMIALAAEAALPEPKENAEMFVTIEFRDDTYKLLGNLDRHPEAGEVAVLKVYMSGTRTSVVQRDDDVLTKDEVAKFQDQVQAAMLTELRTWQKYSCFSRKERRRARNIIDVRWVLKWKWVEAAGSRERVIRARLTVRGFKDAERDRVASYAGTTSRWGQRLVTATAAQQCWPIVTIDVEKAFLQGMTYAEISAETNAPIREVNFELPKGSASLLQSLAGFETYNPSLEVLHCDKPGTGLQDAPYAFSLKLGKCTTKFGCQPLHADKEVIVRHTHGQLDLMAGKHVDDIKITGPVAVVKAFIAAIVQVFGPVKESWNTFTNCGIRHIQCTRTFEVTCDQEEYIACLRPIVNVQAAAMDQAVVLTGNLHGMFLSLLGAAAYCLLTRADAAVYVAALQRKASAPLAIHLKRLNAVVRWLQANPIKIHFRKIGIPGRLVGVSDSAFRKEDESGHAVRGAVIALMDGPPDTMTSCNVQLLEFYSRKQRHVCRATFSAELFGAIDCIDLLLMISTAMHEVRHGVCTTQQLKDLIEGYNSALPVTICIDAKSVLDAVTAEHVKAPAEKSHLIQLQWWREHLDHHRLHSAVWLDTRDMVADALTKGSVDRAELQQFLRGKWTIRHAVIVWKSKSIIPHAGS